MMRLLFQCASRSSQWARSCWKNLKLPFITGAVAVTRWVNDNDPWPSDRDWSALGMGGSDECSKMEARMKTSQQKYGVGLSSVQMGRGRRLDERETQAENEENFNHRHNERDKNKHGPQEKVMDDTLTRVSLEPMKIVTKLYRRLLRAKRNR